MKAGELSLKIMAMPDTGTGVFCVAKQPPSATQKIIGRQTAHKLFLPEKENWPRIQGKGFFALKRVMNPIQTFCKIAPRGIPWRHGPLSAVACMNMLQHSCHTPAFPP